MNVRKRVRVRIQGGQIMIKTVFVDIDISQILIQVIAHEMTKTPEHIGIEALGLHEPDGAASEKEETLRFQIVDADELFVHGKIRLESLGALKTNDIILRRSGLGGKMRG